MWVTTWRTSATSPRLEQGYSVTKTFDVITKSKLFPKTVSASASGTKIIANLKNGKVFVFEYFQCFRGPHQGVFGHIVTIIISCALTPLRFVIDDFCILRCNTKNHSAFLVHMRLRYATQNKNKLQTRLLPFPSNYNHRQPFRETFSRLVNHCVSV